MIPVVHCFLVQCDWVILLKVVLNSIVTSLWLSVLNRSGAANIEPQSLCRQPVSCLLDRSFYQELKDIVYNCCWPTLLSKHSVLLVNHRIGRQMQALYDICLYTGHSLQLATLDRHTQVSPSSIHFVSLVNMDWLLAQNHKDAINCQCWGK